MKNRNINLTACLAIAASLAIGSSRAVAELEPNDNDINGASSIEVFHRNSEPDPATGFISNSDTDYYKVTNSKGFKSISIFYSFEGSSPDTTRLRVLGPDGSEELFNEITDSNTYSAEYTIEGSMTGDFYYICVQGASADGNKPYQLEVLGSPDVDRIDKLTRKCKKLQKKLRKAKKKHNRPLEKIYKKRLKKCQKKLDAEILNG